MNWTIWFFVISSNLVRRNHLFFITPLTSMNSSPIWWMLPHIDITTHIDRVNFGKIMKNVHFSLFSSLSSQASSIPHIRSLMSHLSWNRISTLRMYLLARWFPSCRRAFSIQKSKPMSMRYVSALAFFSHFNFTFLGFAALTTIPSSFWTLYSLLNFPFVLFLLTFTGWYRSGMWQRIQLVNTPCMQYHITTPNVQPQRTRWWRLRCLGNRA